jgi:hypothetical protein
MSRVPSAPSPSRLSTALVVIAVAAAAACPGGDDDGSGETGSIASGTASEGTATAGTAADTATDTAGSGGPAECSFDDASWTFVDVLDMPRMRGVGEEDNTCNPVTTETITLQVQLQVPENVNLGPSATVRVLLFEYDPNVADAAADCVGGLCESIDGSALGWSFEVPNDQPAFSYYIVVDIDADGPDVDGCTLSETDLVTFMPAQGTLMVPMTADGCI